MSCSIETHVIPLHVWSRNDPPKAIGWLALIFTTLKLVPGQQRACSQKHERSKHDNEYRYPEDLYASR
jgi:hypothetical protein